MSRTDKKKQRVQKKQQKSSNTQRFKNPREKITFEKVKELGVIIPQKNPDGNTYHWFVRGRKSCWETKMNFDADGYRFYQRNGNWQVTKPPMPNWVKKRMRKVA